MDTLFSKEENSQIYDILPMPLYSYCILTNMLHAASAMLCINFSHSKNKKQQKLAYLPGKESLSLGPEQTLLQRQVQIALRVRNIVQTAARDRNIVQPAASDRNIRRLVV